MACAGSELGDVAEEPVDEALGARRHVGGDRPGRAPGKLSARQHGARGVANLPGARGVYVGKHFRSAAGADAAVDEEAID